MQNKMAKINDPVLLSTRFLKPLLLSWQESGYVSSSWLCANLFRTIRETFCLAQPLQPKSCYFQWVNTPKGLFYITPTWTSPFHDPLSKIGRRASNPRWRGWNVLHACFCAFDNYPWPSIWSGYDVKCQGQLCIVTHCMGTCHQWKA